jgi:hypothetical protein
VIAAKGAEFISSAANMVETPARSCGCLNCDAAEVANHGSFAICSRLRPLKSMMIGRYVVIAIAHRQPFYLSCVDNASRD